jgi:hypothetical protein
MRPFTNVAQSGATLYCVPIIRAPSERENLDATRLAIATGSAV